MAGDLEKSGQRRRWDVFGRISTAGTRKRENKKSEKKKNKKKKKKKKARKGKGETDEGQVGGGRERRETDRRHLKERAESRKGEREAKMSDMARQDWDRPTLQKQMALAEQRENIRVVKGGWNIEDQGETNRKFGKEPSHRKGWKRIMRSARGREVRLKKEGRVSESCPGPTVNLRKAGLQKAVRVLEERVKELNSRVVLEGNSDGEEKETSSDGGYEKDWRWDNGGWWFRGTFGERVNLQDGETNAGSGRKERRQTEVGMGEFEARRGSREQPESQQLGEQRLHCIEPRW